MRSVTLALVSLVGAFLLGEALLRIVKPSAVGVSRLPAIYAPDPVLGYRYRPSTSGRIARAFDLDRTVFINPRGFHDVHRPAVGKRVVAVVGDSFTAALQVPVERIWTRKLEEALRREGDPGLSVFNLGLDGTGPDVQLELLRENLDWLRPEMVVVAFFANDVLDVKHERVFREVHAGYVLQYQSEEQARRMRDLAERLGADPRRWLFERLYLARLGLHLAEGDRNLFRTNVISPAHVGDAPVNRPRGMASLRPVFESFQALAQAEGFALVVVAVPGREDPERTVQLLRSRVSLPGLRIVDPLPAMRETLSQEGRSFSDLYWPGDPHFDAYGNEVFARALAESLAPSLRRRDQGPGETSPSGSASRRRNLPLR